MTLLYDQQRNLPNSPNFTSHLVLSRVQSNPSEAAEAIKQKIHRIGRLSENWDGYGSLAPNQSAVGTAKTLVALNPNCFNSAPTPEISADEDGRIIIEWKWKSTSKTLALFVGVEDTIVIQSWGPGNPITDTTLDGPDGLQKLWGWLFEQ
jgi:hypothetical protein